MTTWIESHTDLKTNPKARRAARMLGVELAQVIGHLHLLWWWAMDHAFDGDLSDLDPLDIADAADWSGDPDEFVRVLVECGPGDKAGFLDRHDGRLSIHDWREHTAPLRAKREASAKAHHARWHVARGQIDPDCTLCAAQPPTDDTGEPDAPDAPAPDPHSQPDAAALPAHADRNAPDRTGPDHKPSCAADATRESLAVAISTAVGQDSRPPPDTRAGRQLDTAARDLERHGAQPHDVPTRAREYRRRWPAVALTPMALAKHWPDLAPAPPKVPRTDTPEEANARFTALTGQEGAR